LSARSTSPSMQGVMLPAAVEVALYRALKQANYLRVVLYADRKALRDGRVIEVCARLEERLRARCRKAGWVFCVYLAWKLNTAISLADMDPLPVGKLAAEAVQALVLAPLLVFWFRRQHLRVADALRAVLVSVSQAAVPEEASPCASPA
jgi:hypothetical protein